MTRLPIVDFKAMEKALLRLGFEVVRQKGSHVFTDTRTAGQRPCPDTRVEISPAHWFEKYSEKSNLHLTNSFKN